MNRVRSSLGFGIFVFLFLMKAALLEAQPDSLALNLQKGWQQLKELMPESALKSAEEAQKTYDRSKSEDGEVQGDIFLLQGKAMLSMNKLEGASEYVKAALGISPSNPDAWAAWAELAYREGQYNEALNRIEEGIKGSRDSSAMVRLTLQKARIGLQSGILDEAEEALAQLDLRPRDRLPYLQKTYLETELDKVYGRIRVLSQPVSTALPYAAAELDTFSPEERFFHRLLETIWLTREGMPLRQFQHLDSIRSLIQAPYFPAELEAQFWERLMQYGLGFLPSDSISFYSQQAASAYQKAFGPDHLIQVELAMRDAFTLWEIGDFAALIQAMQRYEGIIQQAGIKNHNALPYIWRLEALAYRRTGNFDKALLLLQKAIQALQKSFPEGHWELAGFYNSLANTYANMEEPEALQQSIRTYRKVLDLDEKQFGKDDIMSAGTYHNIGMSYMSLNQLDQALEMLEKSYAITLNAYGSQHLNVARTAYVLGEVYLENGNTSKAIDLGRKGYQIYRKKAHPGENFRIANALHLGRSFSAAGIYDSALFYIQEGFRGYFPNVALDEIEELALTENFVLYDLENVSAMFGILGDLYVNIKQPEKARKAYKTGIAWVDQYEKMASYGSTGYTQDPNFLRDYARFAANNYTLYQKTGKPIYLEEGFAMVDRSKTNTLRYQLQGKRAMSYAGVPDHLLDAGSSLYKAYENAEKEYLDMKVMGTEKEDLVAQEILLKEKKLAYFDWEKDLEASHPKYFQLKYDQHLVFPDEVRDKLKHEETLVIEYFWYKDSDLFIYAFDHEKIIQLMDSAGQVKGLESWIDSLNQMLSLPSNAENKSFDPIFFRSFTTLSHQLYHQLVGRPLDSMGRKNYKRILIIPDKKLTKLNFDILLTEDKEYEHVSYRDLPYLIKDYQIRFEYAASLLEEEKPGKKPARNPYLGLAPGFNNNYRRRLGSQKDLKGFDSRLKYNQEEVGKAYDLLGGQVFRGEEAVERKAKEYMEGASILHFATHTLLNDSFPMYTSLVLEGGNDSLEDGFLHAYEIYPKKLQADLAVLSACETGLGKWKHGEGMMSLARAFKYAGCSNIVMSLWQADDQATSDIITRFFAYLKKGYPKDEALRKAKLDFLDQANGKQFPHYWAPFVLVGDDAEVQLRKEPLGRYGWQLLLAAGILAILGIGILRRNRKS